MENMVTLKAGSFPGRIEEYAIAVGTTVQEVLDMAGLTVEAEQEIKLDNVPVTPSTTIGAGAQTLLVSKRLKGAR